MQVISNFFDSHPVPEDILIHSNLKQKLIFNIDYSIITISGAIQD